MPSPTVEYYSQLISLAVHEFRTPASVVGGYLRMLQRDAESPLTERQRKMIDEAEKSCARLVAVISELSEVGKLDGGAVSISREPLDLTALIGDVADHVQEAKDRDVHLVVRGDDAAATIQGDAKRLRSAFDAVFRCILREKAGPATVVAERRRERIDDRPSVVVVVADAASVQEAYARPRVPFFEQRGGLGLAIPLARRVIEAHGGRLLAAAPNGQENDAIGRGSAIIIVPLTE
jgi:signal transduction histidine kinase